jgi:ankyrin repeat protein
MSQLTSFFARPNIQRPNPVQVLQVGSSSQKKALVQELYNAIQDKSLDRTTVALAKGASKDTKHPHYLTTPLTQATISDDPGTVRLLLENLADPKKKDGYGYTWLSVIRSKGVLQAAIEIYGTQPVAEDAWNNPEAIKIALKNMGMDIKQEGIMHGAAANGLVALVDALLQLGANVNSGRQPALHSAAECGQENVVKLLLNHGAKKDQRSSAGFFPVTLAERGGHSSIVAFLQSPTPHDSGLSLKERFRISTRSSSHQSLVDADIEQDKLNKQLIDVCKMSPSTERSRRIENAIASDADPNAVDSDGHTALFYVAKPTYVVSSTTHQDVLYLIQKGANDVILDPEKQTTFVDQLITTINSIPHNAPFERRYKKYTFMNILFHMFLNEPSLVTQKILCLDHFTSISDRDHFVFQFIEKIKKEATDITPNFESTYQKIEQAVAILQEGLKNTVLSEGPIPAQSLKIVKNLSELSLEQSRFVLPFITTVRKIFDDETPADQLPQLLATLKTTLEEGVDPECFTVFFKHSFLYDAFLKRSKGLDVIRVSLESGKETLTNMKPIHFFTMCREINKIPHQELLQYIKNMTALFNVEIENYMLDKHNLENRAELIACFNYWETVLTSFLTHNDTLPKEIKEECGKAFQDALKSPKTFSDTNYTIQEFLDGKHKVRNLKVLAGLVVRQHLTQTPPTDLEFPALIKSGEVD